MASEEVVKYYSMYAIAEVESNWNWAANYHGDNSISIGIMQNYGQNGRNLLYKCSTDDPEGWAIFAASAPRLAEDVLDSSKNTWNWWTSRPLNDVESRAWHTMAQRDENHLVQERRWIDDTTPPYLTKLLGDGFSYEYPKPLIYAIGMYHQGPVYANQVISSAGGTATLQKLHTTCLNNGVLGQYRNRYNTLFNRLNGWDGDSMPPDFGQVGDVSIGENPGGGNSQGKRESGLSYIIRNGDNLVLYGDDDATTGGLIFAKSAGERWIPSLNKVGTPIEGGNTDDGNSSGEPSEDGARIIAKARSQIGQFSYSMGAGRLDPDSSGVTDCSAYVNYLYRTVVGKDVGTYTGAQQTDGREIARGRNWNEIPWSSMQAGDYLLMSRSNANYEFGAGGDSHIELYTGEGRNIIGSGSTPCPTEKDGNVFNDRLCWMVRRVL